ncbi:class I SAM-dependent methyltransferase [Tissierella sp. Yu-01]|uniref:class I SAM-dependent methyltransferase n=1 Tax=Tissierella sp. Yu-01 TaxID=3035694 RepID=UPI00240D009D|nr:class I SAM-dependent methyltransferase [Tissierella sp. Yu-01]WFA08967.1 methyltransferase domain-containing protein [Tissierella sp. Yu-01]WFA08989.1 methyltransferase domain-containing protein [Tissierella sp. Yu-01]
MNKIEQWYDEKYDEWDRLERHKIEFDITKRYLDEYITGENLEIFDIGGGPGRYALYLAEKRHKVSLLDLSKRNIEVAKEKSVEKGIILEDYIHGNALELDEYEQKYEVILLMGPLYHLVDERDRKACIEGALKLLKSNGIIVASFISNYAPIQNYLKNLYPINSVDELLVFLDDGISDDYKGFTQAYFTDPKEAKQLMNSFGLQEIIFAGVENILNPKEKEINMLEEEEYNNWLDICYRLSKDSNLIGTSEHFLYIGRK